MKKIPINIYLKLHKEHLCGKSLGVLASENDMRLATIYYAFKRLNLQIIKCTNEQRIRYPVNHDFFETIDSEIKAYILGWIASDGFITKRHDNTRKSNRVGIKLAEKDKDILYLIKSYLSPTRKLYKDISTLNGNQYIAYKLEIPSNKMVSDLINTGITYNKTGDEYMPKLSQSLMPHFIRGYFDGDGSISISYNILKPIIYICCSNKLFLEQLQKYLPGEYVIYTETRKTKDMYRLQPRNKHTRILFYHYMYSKCNYQLNRKFKKYTKYVNTVLNKEINKSLSV